MGCGPVLRICLTRRRNVRDPGVEEGVFRELDIPAAAAHDLSDDDDDDGSGRGTEDGSDGVGGGDVGHGDSAPATEAATSAALPPALTSTSRDLAPRQQGLGEARNGNGNGSSGGSRGRVGGLLAPLPLRSSQPARFTNADVLRGIGLSTVATAAAAAATAATAGDGSDAPAVSITTATLGGAKEEAGAAAMQGSSGLGFEVYREETAGGGGGKADDAPSGGLGFPVFEDARGGDAGGGAKGSVEAVPPDATAAAGDGNGLGFPVYRDGSADSGSDSVVKGGEGGCETGVAATASSCSSSPGAAAAASSSVPGLGFSVFRDDGTGGGGGGRGGGQGGRGDDDDGPGSVSSSKPAAGLGFPVFRDVDGGDGGPGADPDAASDPVGSAAAAVLGRGGRGAGGASSLPFSVFVDAPAAERARGGSVSSKPAAALAASSSSRGAAKRGGDGPLPPSPSRSLSRRAAVAAVADVSILEDSYEWDAEGGGAGGAVGNLSNFSVFDDSPLRPVGVNDGGAENPPRNVPGTSSSSSTASARDVVVPRGSEGAGTGAVAACGGTAPAVTTAASLASSLRRKSAAGLHAGGAMLLELSRISEGETSRVPEGDADVDGGGVDGDCRAGGIHEASSASLLHADDHADIGDGGGNGDDDHHCVDGAGYAASRTGWLRPRTPGPGASPENGLFQADSPRAPAAALATPLGSNRYDAGAGGGGFSRGGARGSSRLSGGDFGEPLPLNSRQSLGSSWGGCSTIKRRGEDLTGGGIMGLRQPGDAEDDYEGADDAVGGFDYTARGIEEAVDENGGAEDRLASRGISAGAVAGAGAGAAAANRRNSRRRLSSGGSAGAGGDSSLGSISGSGAGITPVPAGRGRHSAGSGRSGRSGSGRGAGGGVLPEGVPGVEDGGAGVGVGVPPGGGRADYHSLCFSSSSSSVATPHSSLTASPFQLLDADDST